MTASDELLYSEQVLQVPYVYSAGPVVSRFLIGLRDEKKFYAIRCVACGKNYVPPRAVCGGCFGQMTEWTPVGPEGRLENFTWVHYHEPSHPVAAPFAVGLVRLDGADTCLLHLVKPLSGVELAVGARVRPVFAEERRGHILDVRHFQAASSG